MGLILFSSKERTMVELRIGQITNSQQLWNYIDSLQCRRVKGGYTRTDLAFILAKSMSKHFHCCCLCVLLSLLRLTLLLSLSRSSSNRKI